MIRYGIAGFGLHAVRRLMPGFAKAQNSRVTALSRRNISKAKESAAQYGIANAFDSVEALCACEEVDAVFVASPNSLHLRDVLTSVRFGKPVLCEKPMALNADEARQMVEAATNAGVLLGIAHCFRFEDSVRRIRERVDAGEIGRPLLARCEFSYQGVGHPRVWLTDAALSGGGPIADVGVHCIDTLRYILGQAVRRVGTIAHGDEHSGGVEANALLSLEFSGGTMGIVACSLRAPYRTPIEIVGTEGTLRAEDGLNVERPIRIELVRDSKVVYTEEVLNDRTYARQVDAFAEAIESRRPFEVPGEEGLKNQLVLDAAYRSAKSGKFELV